MQTDGQGAEMKAFSEGLGRMADRWAGGRDKGFI